MMVKYTYLEAEEIMAMHDGQYLYKTIAEQINKDFHQGKAIRNESSIGYVISKIYNEDDGWLERLEEKWLQNQA